MNIKLLIAILFFSSFSVVAQPKLKNLVDYVNTLQGTNSKHELTR